MKKVFVVSLFLAFSVSEVDADIYKIYWPQENIADPENNPDDTSWQAIQITNTSSNTVIDGSMSGIYEQDFSGLTAEASEQNNGASYQVNFSLEGTGQAPTVLDFSGNILKFRAETAIQLNPDGVIGDAYTYDVVYEINPITGELLSTKLVASTEAEANLAGDLGYSVDLEFSSLNRSGSAGTFQSYAANITNEGDANIATKGGLVTKQLSNPDGSSLIRQEDDGSIHIGENSVVIVDSPNSSSGNDMIYSSAVDGSTLQIGNIDSHSTIIKGTLEVTGESSFHGAIDMQGNRITDLGAPLQSTDAVNKAYTDTVAASTLTSANSYTDTVAASTLTSANSYTDTVAASTLTSANSYTDTVAYNLFEGIEDSNALSAALSALPNSAPDAVAYCGGGFGAYGNSQALAMGCASNLNEKVSLNFGASVLSTGGTTLNNRDFDDYSFKAGLTYKFGVDASKSKSAKTAALEAVVFKQQSDLLSMTAREAYKDTKIAEYEDRITKLEEAKLADAAEYNNRLAKLEEHVELLTAAIKGDDNKFAGLVK